MNRIRLFLGIAAFFVALAVGSGTVFLLRQAGAAPLPQQSTSERDARLRKPYPAFEIDVIVNGRPLTEYYARGRTYIEALQGAEYQLRLRNSSPERVAVALSVDGLNTIDARHTSAWNSSKWVIEPHQTITISGWQMSSERARHFYFTNERDSYGAKLGQTANLGVISAVFFRERYRPISPPYPITREKNSSRRSDESTSAGPSPQSSAGQSARDNRAVRPTYDDDYAATGIGRSVHHDVRWVNMQLDPRSAGEVTIRYEYYQALVRLGVYPRQQRHQPLQRREDSRGFSPEP